MDSDQHMKHGQYNGDGQLCSLIVQGLGNHRHISTCESVYQSVGAVIPH